MTLNQLLYIITIADEGSLNKAAEKLYMTQPSLTSSLREVESELGVTISAELEEVSRLPTMGQSFFKTQDICIASMNR